MGPRREYPEHPFVGVGALVHRDGKVLLVRRAKEPNLGKWIIPGGLVELGEGLEDAVAREVKEELGITAKLEGMLDLASEIILDKEKQVRYHYVLVDFLVSIGDERIALNRESNSYDWFTPESVLKLDTTENTKRMVGRYVEIMKARANQHGLR